MTFQVGNMVRWKSQSGGFSKEKIGEIVAELPHDTSPDQKAFPDLYPRGPNSCGYGRPYESYVVKVGNRHYWPRASLLELQGPSELAKVKEKLQRALSSLRSYDPKLADHIEAL